ncbi:hypothetical protein, partial [Falsiroseomonas oryzae]|uniref:hypothetical protein n=1 Tax=Falsiroseomonas oryzae TaxID=2766473 RepID=UPI0022EA9951
HVVELVREGPANLFVAIAADPVALLDAQRATVAAGFPPLDDALRVLPAMLRDAPSARMTDFADAAQTRPRAALLAIRGGLAPPRLWGSIVAQTAGALGQFGADNGIADTAFRTGPPPVDLTPLDQRLLRLLYLSALQPGQTVAEARAAALRAVGFSRVQP